MELCGTENGNDISGFGYTYSTENTVRIRVGEISNVLHLTSCPTLEQLMWADITNTQDHLDPFRS